MAPQPSESNKKDIISVTFLPCESPDELENMHNKFFIVAKFL